MSRGPSGCACAPTTNRNRTSAPGYDCRRQLHTADCIDANWCDDQRNPTFQRRAEIVKKFRTDLGILIKENHHIGSNLTGTCNAGILRRCYPCVLALRDRFILLKQRIIRHFRLLRVIDQYYAGFTLQKTFAQSLKIQRIRVIANNDGTGVHSDTTVVNSQQNTK